MDRAHPLFPVFNEIGIIAQLSQRVFESVMPAGMTLAQFSVLNHFVRLGGDRTPAVLADAFQVTRATMTSTLQKLEGKGLISVVPDANDGRSKRVSLTESGREMRDRCVMALEPEFVRLESFVKIDSVRAIMPHLMELRRVLDAQRSTGGAVSG